MFAKQFNKPCMRQIVNFNNVDYEPSERFPELWENETVDFHLEHVEFSFSSDPAKRIGAGKLYITSKRLLWIGSEKAFDFDIPFITLHAVSKDPQTYVKPCVYCQVDTEDDEMYGENDDDEDTDDQITEFYLIPEEEKDLSTIFEALSHAALLNPDPEDEMEGDGGEGEFIFNQDEVRLGAEQARILDHLESVFEFPPEDNNDNNNEGGDDQQPTKWSRK
jgi:hypothetical protein